MYDKPTLIIMAAGLASRFGGNKQLTPVDDEQQMIIDYSLYDAHKAGFERVIFILKESMKDQFHQQVGCRVQKHMRVEYAFQALDSYFPKDLSIPADRQKPWGTGHATLCAKELIHGPFAVINADDFYGRTAFQSIFDFLSGPVRPDHYAMVGYRIEKTLSASGSVSRGVCQVDDDGFLTDIQERTEIYPEGDGAKYTLDQGSTFVSLPKGTQVSMNLWGFDGSFMEKIHDRFEPWLRENLPVNPLKCEYFLPYLPHLLIREGAVRVSVLPTNEKWYGMTYHKDLDEVRAAIAGMKAEGVYPEKLW